MKLMEIKTYEVLPGTSIKEAVKEAIDISKENNCAVHFSFNGIKLKVYKFDTIQEVIEYYHKKIKEKSG